MERLFFVVHPLRCQSWSLSLSMQKMKPQYSRHLIIKLLLFSTIYYLVYITCFHENLYRLFIHVMAYLAFKHVLVKIKSLDWPFSFGINFFKYFLCYWEWLIFFLNVRQYLVHYVWHYVSAFVLLVLFSLFLLWWSWSIFLIFSLDFFIWIIFSW